MAAPVAAQPPAVQAVGNGRFGVASSSNDGRKSGRHCGL